MKPESSALVVHKNDQPREAAKSKDSTADRIYKYYHSKSRVELTEEEEGIRVRWEKAWFLLCRHKTVKEVTAVIGKMFNIGKSIAYDDVRNAQMLFGNPQQDMREAKKAMAETWIVRGLRKAWKNEDMESYQKLLKQYCELNGLSDQSNDDTLANLLKNFKPTQVIITSSDLDLTAAAQKLQDQITKDIEHTVVNED